MNYMCNKCKKDLGDNKEVLFISKTGEYLCNDCSDGVEPVDGDLLLKIEEDIKKRKH